MAGVQGAESPGLLPSRQAGFTLLEILVALIVLGLLMAGLTQGVHFGLQAWAVQSRGIATRGDMDAIDRVVRHLVAHADPGTYTQPPLFTGTASRVEFRSDLPESAASLPTRHAEVALFLDRSHQLVLRWRPAVHATLFVKPQAKDEVLLGNVDRIVLSYLPQPQPGEAPPGWKAACCDGALPALVRLHLVFPSGDRRHWPDIVAAPMRSRPDA